MPLSRARDRARKKFQPNSNLDNTDTFQPNQAKIKELRDMMQDISMQYDGKVVLGAIEQGTPPKYSDAYYDSLLGVIGEAVPITVIDEREDWPDIDADGNLIPDF